MIITELYKGQGLGNQLACYVTTRVIALDKGYAFGIQHPERFKGLDFLSLDFGEKVVGGYTPLEGQKPSRLPESITSYYEEKKILHPHNGDDIRMYDKSLVVINDNTKIDGLMQDEQYIFHRKDEIREWLRISQDHDCHEYADNDICVINFRGGEYARHPRFFLQKKYWNDAVSHMRKINPEFRFVVITDDVFSAKKFFQDFDVFHFSIGKDYSIIHNAHYLILSNSSFAWFPAWTSENLKFCIAPKYWARHNVSDGYWSLGYNITSGWKYLDREGFLSTYEECLRELKTYIQSHPDLYTGVVPIQIQAMSLIGRIKQHTPSSLKTLAKRVLNEWRWLYTTLHRPYDLYTQRKREKEWRTNKELREYRKSIKIYDAFNFFNELELLEIRLNILDPYVDYFVLVESTLTHSGLPKELYYANNKDRFSKFNHKILHFVITDPLKSFEDAYSRLGDPSITEEDKSMIRAILTSDNIRPGQTSFLRDFYEKEYVKKVLLSLNIADTDFCYVSDLDEIWNPQTILDYSRDDLYKFKQLPYMYYVNNRSNEDWRGWTGTIATKFKNIRNQCLGHLRTLEKNSYIILKNGGWHFSFMGGTQKIKTKLESYSHQEINTNSVKQTVENKLRSNHDIRGRGVRFWIDENDLPIYLLENKKTYAAFFKTRNE